MKKNNAIIIISYIFIVILILLLKSKKSEDRCKCQVIIDSLSSRLKECDSCYNWNYQELERIYKQKNAVK